MAGESPGPPASRPSLQTSLLQAGILSSDLPATSHASVASAHPPNTQAPSSTQAQPPAQQPKPSPGFPVASRFRRRSPEEWAKGLSQRQPLAPTQPALPQRHRQVMGPSLDPDFGTGPPPALPAAANSSTMRERFAPPPASPDAASCAVRPRYDALPLASPVDASSSMMREYVAHRPPPPFLYDGANPSMMRGHDARTPLASHHAASLLTTPGYGAGPRPRPRPPPPPPHNGVNPSMMREHPVRPPVTSHHAASPSSTLGYDARPPPPPPPFFYDTANPSMMRNHHVRPSLPSHHAASFSTMAGYDARPPHPPPPPVSYDAANSSMMREHHVRPPVTSHHAASLFTTPFMPRQPLASEASSSLKRVAPSAVTADTSKRGRHEAASHQEHLRESIVGGLP